MIIRFSKYEGAGNDFVLFDAREGEANPPAEFIKALCDRHKGVGGDGMMILDMSPHKGVDFRMRFYNADGLEGTMCGNGGRCITLFAHQLGIGGRQKTFEGIDGVHRARILSADDNCGVVELGVIDVCKVELLDGGDYLLYDGSNHVVRFVEDVDAYDVDTVGRELRYDPRFDYLNGVNVNFVEVVGGGVFKIRTYERGVENETLACGTGAVASAIATRIHTGSNATEWKARARGGELSVRFEVEGESFRNIVLTGPARKVFSGKLDTSNFR
ncbi:MAG: diaminopimelate epimerase [Rikenellaceae bacterium]|nr:diaminopimelate epimerase [Rikenellaceae bacterium]